MEDNVAVFLGFSTILTVFSAISIVLFYLLARWRITGFMAFLVVYVIWIIVIGVVTLPKIK